MDLPLPEDVRAACLRLKSTRDGDRGVLDAVACGRRAVPALTALLFSRDPSGLSHARLRAAEALTGLDAREVLIDFLGASHEMSDPVEQLGEDEVVSAVARALTDPGEERVFDLLLRLARDRILPGVVAALGKSLRPEAIPELLRALGEDETRGEAERALQHFGEAAVPALLVAAARAPDGNAHETESDLRKRRSALGILAEIGVPANLWPIIRQLPNHPDRAIAATASAIALKSAPIQERDAAVSRLTSLALAADAILEARINHWLGEYRASSAT
ncbi:hypothetical protein [Rhodoblastus sp.]|uniref:HEAT repeat domain-containing protein n=1 Tax=Rhodoblastus sp. TaxID=1962975 RepID=UPI002637F606|nr:hypothetical protein [Rhodoblastus sp.]